MGRQYKACIEHINRDHSRASNEFLDQLIDSVKALPDAIIIKNDRHDIYSEVMSELGPYEDLTHRRAVMCEVLRVMAAFESDWDWNEGVDENNERSKRYKIAEETGAFQVSADSMYHHSSLREYVDEVCGDREPQTFIDKTKSDHDFAVGYCARLLRFNTTWCGTMPQVVRYVDREAMQEFREFLASPDPVTPTPSPAPTPKSELDQQVEAKVNEILAIARDADRWEDVQNLAAQRLFRFAHIIYPKDGCAITLSVLLQKAGISISDTFMAIDFGRALIRRGWHKVPVGQQKPGDIGSTCGMHPVHGVDHVYLVLSVNGADPDEMIVADNQATAPHRRTASGEEGKSPTRFFLRATRD